MDEWVKAAWRAAEQLGLTDRWEFWVGLVLLFALLVLLRRLGPPVWLYLRSLPPPKDLVERPPAPPMPLDKDGTVHLKQQPPKDYL